MASSTFTRETLDTAILLREAVTDYILADALDGKIRESEWTAMHAAFSISDVKALTRLAAALSRDFDFVEPGAVLKTLTRKERESFSTGSLQVLLRKTEGTRLYARRILESSISETPFD